MQLAEWIQLLSAITGLVVAITGLIVVLKRLF
jgi:hypothetical protein